MRRLLPLLFKIVVPKILKKENNTGIKKITLFNQSRFGNLISNKTGFLLYAKIPIVDRKIKKQIDNGTNERGLFVMFNEGKIQFIPKPANIKKEILNPIV